MKKITALFLAVLMVFSLCACGSSAKGQSSSYAVAAPQADYAAYDKETEMPMAAEEAAYGGFAANAAAEPVETNGTPTEAPSAGDIAVDKIIYSASATIETTDFDETLSVVMVKMESLWFCVAVHTTWNFSQSIFFGLPNSGIVSQGSFLHLDAATDSALYSTAFGVEGTITTTFVLLVLSLIVLLCARRKASN